MVVKAVKVERKTNSENGGISGKVAKLAKGILVVIIFEFFRLYAKKLLSENEKALFPRNWKDIIPVKKNRLIFIKSAHHIGVIFQWSK